MSTMFWVPKGAKENKAEQSRETVVETAKKLSSRQRGQEEGEDPRGHRGQCHIRVL